jgi:PAS domain S-box-containing protein
MFGEVSKWLFDTGGLTPHGFCLLWEPGLLWLHAISDVGIGLSYFAIPLFLIAMIRARPDIGFRPLFGLFAAFIMLCGAGHWLDLLTLWVPAYGVEGVVKAATAIVSIMTAIAMMRLIPQATIWPTPNQLREATSNLLVVQQSEIRMAHLVAESSNARDELARELLRRETAERLVVSNEECFRLVLQSSVTDALCLLDADGNIETWNAGAERLKGYISAEIIGQNFSILFTPEDISIGEPARLLAVARDNGRSTAEGLRLHKNGSCFLARFTIDAVHNHDGTLRGFVEVTTDITAQRIEEEQRAIIIEAAPNGMMIVDETGIIRLVNTQIETIFGYPRGWLIGQSVETLVPENFRIAHAGMRAKFTSGQDVRAMATGREFTGRRRDGSDVAIEILLSPVKTPRGRIVIASLFDVTERRRVTKEQHTAETGERLAADATNAALDRLSKHLAKARDRAEQANRAKSRFLAGMSHELRTPLSGIMGYAHLLHLEGDLNPTQSGRVDAMMEAGKHLLEMIACVLDLSEIESERATLQAVEFDLKATAAACIDLVRPTAEAKGLALSLVVSSTTPQTVVTDPTRLRQVLINLLGNAVKFTSQGRVEVQLGTSADGSALRVEVSDTGPGITADQRQRLFQDFERLDHEANSKVEGAGLGLALSSRLATLMGGRLGHDDNPGGGSVFWLELPLIAEAPVMPEAASETSDVPPAQLTRLLHVLVVDDVLMNREIAGSFLRARGHEVTCVEGGAEGVAAAASTDFDCILMDVRMPEVDGLEATRRIRALAGERGRVPIVALTAQAFSEQIAECRKVGMDSHLAKPFNPDTLLAAVLQAVSAGLSPSLNLDLVPMPTPVQVASAVMGSELPVFDAESFQRTAAFLPDETVASYLGTIDTIGESLALGLHERDVLTSNAGALAETAHKLAGSAGMFGFERLAALGRRFERAVDTGAADVSDLALGLCMAIEATREEIHIRNRQKAQTAAKCEIDAPS